MERHRVINKNINKRQTRERERITRNNLYFSPVQSDSIKRKRIVKRTRETKNFSNVEPKSRRVSYRHTNEPTHRETYTQYTYTYPENTEHKHTESCEENLKTVSFSFFVPWGLNARVL